MTIIFTWYVYTMRVRFVVRRCCQTCMEYGVYAVRSVCGTGCVGTGVSLW